MEIASKYLPAYKAPAQLFSCSNPPIPLALCQVISTTQQSPLSFPRKRESIFDFCIVFLHLFMLFCYRNLRKHPGRYQRD
jgi:hypothetical protein